jgi:hypothetical protein
VAINYCYGFHWLEFHRYFFYGEFKNEYPHETDQAIKAFFDWTDTFQYFPNPDKAHQASDEVSPLKVANI